MLPDIIAGLKVMLATRAAERERRAEEARRQAEWGRRRQLANKRQARERRRFDYLNQILSCRDEVTRLQSFVDQFPEASASADVERFNAWVKAHLARQEAHLTVNSITAVIRAQELFPEVDPFEDPLGEPEEPTGRWY